jgi:2-polyprenyl-6-methoxyphenol hydroxylase-like FAD-dependent oxidoreductase
MQESSPHVLVVGGGLGGLSLAQGLRQAGISVAVYERDATAADRAQGYRISIDDRGSEALRACLPPALYALFEATCGQPSIGAARYTFDGDAYVQLFAMEFSLRPLPGIPAVGRAVDRLTLRETLLAGLEEAVVFGKEFTRYELTSTGGVRAYFADGTTASGDLLVAADGVGSRVRQQLLPEAELVDTGVRWLGGRTVLDERLRMSLPAAVSDRAVWLQDRSVQFFLAPVFFRRRPDDAVAALWPGLSLTDNDDFLMWALIGQRDQLIRPDLELAGASEPELYRLALEATAGSHPALRAMVEASAPERSFYLAIRAAGPLNTWPSGPVTFVGDAIHASPVNGTGANAALEDAALLCRHLTVGGRTLPQAVEDYGVELRARIHEMRAALERSRAMRPDIPGGHSPL